MDINLQGRIEKYNLHLNGAVSSNYQFLKGLSQRLLTEGKGKFYFHPQIRLIAWLLGYESKQIAVESVEYVDEEQEHAYTSAALSPWRDKISPQDFNPTNIFPRHEYTSRVEPHLTPSKISLVKLIDDPKLTEAFRSRNLSPLIFPEESVKGVMQRLGLLNYLGYTEERFEQASAFV